MFGVFKKQESMFGNPEVVKEGKHLLNYYINRSTGEITESHSIAMEWYRFGDEVEVFRNGRMAIALVM